MQFTREFYLRSADFDKNERLTPQTILELFQDVAGNHAENMGIGYLPLLEKNLLWVIARTKFTVEKQVKRYTSVKVKTWPLAAKRMLFRREYLLFDENGDIAVRGSSDWMLINSVTRKLYSGSDIYPANGEFLQELALDEPLKKIKEIEGEITYSQVVPQFTDIDLNGHVNNTKYANYAINALNIENNEIKSFQIDYQKETLINEPLNITCVRVDKKSVIKGENAEGEKKFTCEIIYK